MIELLVFWFDFFVKDITCMHLLLGWSRIAKRERDRTTPVCCLLVCLFVSSVACSLVLLLWGCGGRNGISVAGIGDASESDSVIQRRKSCERKCKCRPLTNQETLPIVSIPCSLAERNLCSFQEILRKKVKQGQHDMCHFLS
jgi:hypothetical protein